MSGLLRFLVVALCVCSSTAFAAAAVAPAPGEVPPDEVGRDRDGGDVRLSDYRGQVVVMSFWASWCGPCIDEMTMLEKLQRAATRERLTVIAVNWKEDRDRYREIARRLKDFQLILTSDPKGRVGAQYAVKAIPRLFIIGRDGRVAYSHLGYDPESSMPRIVDEVNALLQQASPGAAQALPDGTAAGAP
ncbi:MAG: TlpA disulfide reductase family protein [Solimonas sp.]